MQKTSEAFERLFVYDAENDPQDLNLRFAMSMDYLENVARFNAMTWWENKAYALYIFLEFRLQLTVFI